MNEIAKMWATERLRVLEQAQLRKLAKEMRESYAEIEPLRKEANARRKANMRQDGPTGFVMVTP